MNKKEGDEHPLSIWQLLAASAAEEDKDDKDPPASISTKAITAAIIATATIIAAAPAIAAASATAE